MVTRFLHPSLLFFYYYSLTSKNIENTARGRYDFLRVASIVRLARPGILAYIKSAFLSPWRLDLDLRIAIRCTFRPVSPFSS